MADAIRWVGLDVHAAQTTVAVLDQGSGELTRVRLRGSPDSVVPEFLAGFEGRVIGVYEAGPTGMGLARSAGALGIDLRVCAPGLIPRKAERSGQDRCARCRALGAPVGGRWSVVRSRPERAGGGVA